MTHFFKPNFDLILLYWREKFLFVKENTLKGKLMMKFKNP